jgi:hypothetical protein
MRVTNGISLGWPLPLTVTTVNSVQTLKAAADRRTRENASHAEARATAAAKRAAAIAQADEAYVIAIGEAHAQYPHAAVSEGVQNGKEMAVVVVDFYQATLVNESDAHVNLQKGQVVEIEDKREEGGVAEGKDVWVVVTADGNKGVAPSKIFALVPAAGHGPRGGGGGGAGGGGAAAGAAGVGAAGDVDALGDPLVFDALGNPVLYF